MDTHTHARAHTHMQQVTPRVFTSNESPPSEKIPFHHEMAQVPEPPTHLFFYCEVPTLTGGEVSQSVS